MRLVLDTDRVSLIQGDTLEVLRTFADKSFDAILTDPPYSPHVHAKFGKERRNDMDPGHWMGDGPRAPLTFPPMTDDLIAAVAAEYVRVCKGWILSFSDFYNSYKWGLALQSLGGSWVRTGQWVKTNPMPQMTGDRPACGAEDIVIGHVSDKGFEWNGHGKAALWRGSRDASAEHPNQKPTWLLQSLLGMFCKPGALVLDPYFGSGTTAIGALATERLQGEFPLETACPKCAKKILELYQPPLPVGVNVVGIEGDPRWIDLSIRRIREASPALLAA